MGVLGKIQSVLMVYVLMVLFIIISKKPSTYGVQM